MSLHRAEQAAQGVSARARARSRRERDDALGDACGDLAWRGRIEPADLLPQNGLHVVLAEAPDLGINRVRPWIRRGARARPHLALGSDQQRGDLHVGHHEGSQAQEEEVEGQVVDSA